MASSVRVAATLLLSLCSACSFAVSADGVIPGVPKGSTVYTLTNLHPDEQNRRLYSANFQQPGLIPICSEVTLLKCRDDYMSFRVNATRTECEYPIHKAGGESLKDNLALYFGTECPKAELDSLTPEERDSVRFGVVAVGMRKKAVLLALGYPPLRDTPSLESPRWRYWHSRWNSFIVGFDDQGKVIRIAQ